MIGAGLADRARRSAVERWPVGRAAAVLVSLAWSVAVAGGCGGGDDHPIAEHPTWMDDVRPIIVANCVPCHNATSEEPSYDYATFADFMAVAANLEFLTSMGEGAIRRPALSSPMPPPPAAPLPAWQVETLVRWFKDPR